MSEPAARSLARAEAGLQRRLLGGMLLLVVAGTGHELLLQLGVARFGVALVIPLVLAALLLWRPGPEAIAAVALLFAIGLLIPLYTGGGMVLDWVRHYEIALHYGGRASAVTAPYLASRTALSEQLLGAMLAHVPTFWVFQLGSLLLNSLWLWPAGLLLRTEAGDERRGRLLAVALNPFVLYLSAYTWPWSLAGFFLLSAVWLARRDGRVAAAGLGLAAAGSLLVHPGTVGMVLGLAAWVFRYRRVSLPIALTSGSAVLLSQIPWIWSVTGGQGPVALVVHSDPGQASVPLLAYAFTRPLLALHTMIPFPPLVAGLALQDFAFSVLVHSLPGALLVLLILARRELKPIGLEAYVAYTALVVNLLVYPAEMFMVGIVESLWVAVVIVAIAAVDRLPPARLPRILAANTVLTAIALGLALWLAIAAPPADVNRLLAATYRAKYLVSILGPGPGLGALVTCAVASWLALRGIPRRPFRHPQP